MRILKNLIFIAVILFIFTLNIFNLLDKTFSKEFYLITLNITISLLIAIEVLYSLRISKLIDNLKRENDRKNLIISDYQLESTFLNTLIDIIETFGETLTLDEVIEKMLEASKNVFEEETVGICLFGDRYKLSFKGKEIDIPMEIVEELSVRGKPILVNNISTFPLYKKLFEYGITSFIVSGLYQKKRVVGMIGVFSFTNKKFTLRDLNLLRMISVPISLLIENVELFDKTKLLSITDSLTQTYNRRYLEKVLSDILMKSQINYTPVSIAMCDVDYFKFYNDTNGHPAGDYVLKTIAEILKKGVKGSDVVARYGGEEFIIIFPDTTKENAIKICEKLRKSIRDFKFPNEEAQPNGDLTISFGIAAFPEDGAKAEELIKKADIALYKAKGLGRDKVIPA